MTGAAPTLVGLGVTGEVGPWAAAGFAVDDRSVPIGAVTLRTGATGGPGIVAWSLTGVDDGAIDGLTTVTGRPTAPSAADHPNGALAIDHLVVASPDLDRTTVALEAFGIGLRRIRDAGRMEQRFFRVGQPVLELVGRPGATGEGPATFWGLAVTVADLDATAAVLGDALGPVSDAVQPGRRIATLRHESLGVPVPVAFMTPAPRRPSPP